MAPTKTDRELFLASLAIFDRPDNELRHQVLDADVDVDSFVERAFGGNETLPPL